MLSLTKNSGQGFKDVDSTKGIITGYFAAFNILDSDGDVIEKGAFSKTISERGPDGTKRIKYLQDHDRYKAVGVLKSLEEDTYGLKYTGKVGRHTVGQDFLKMVQDEIITEHSFGYKIIKEQKEADGNHLKELYLFEGSGLQVDAANPHTPILGVKSKEDIVLLFDALEKALKNGTYSDECFKNTIVPKYNAIKSILPQFSTEPQAVTADDFKSILNDIF